MIDDEDEAGDDDDGADNGADDIYVWVKNH